MVSYKGIGFSNNMVKKLASEGVKQIAQKGTTSALANPVSKVAPSLVLATLIGLGLKDTINKNDISLPMSKKSREDEKNNKLRLETINDIRRANGLPEITMSGEYLYNSQPKATVSPKKASLSTNEYKSSNQPLSRSQKGTDGIANLIRKAQGLDSIDNIGDVQQQVTPIANSQYNYTLEDLLAMKQAQAQERQSTYQPQLDLLQAIIQNAKDMSDWQGRQSNISAGLAGIAGNDLIYKSAQENNPLKRTMDLANIYGQQAQLQDQLRYDPYQTMADISFAQSEGYNPIMALANNNLIANITNAQKIQTQRDIANQKLQQDILQRQQKNAMDMLNYDLAVQKLQELRDYHNKSLANQTQKLNAKELNNLNSSLRSLDQLEKMINANPQAIGLDKGIWGSKFVNRIDKNKQNIMTRTLIDDFRTQLRHALTGAQFSVKEIDEYDRFLPNITDSSQIALAKIQALRSRLQNDLQAKGLSGNNQNQLPVIDIKEMEAELNKRGLRK